ncbi:MAG: histidine kinase [Gemmatimonadota bacterium]|nr:MAG: histidine kinase [Gemmatimonadota bacterium]
MVDELGLTTRYGMRTQEFRDLMEFRVQEILLVASQYDTFVLEEDGQLTELLLEEYRSLALNLRYTPHFSPATTGAEALRLIEEVDRGFDMVVVSPRLHDMEAGHFAHQVKAIDPALSVCVLAAHAWNLPDLDGLRRSGEVDFLFLWQGDVKSLLAMIKQVEDQRNADHDVLKGGVQVIILVEDEVRYYSTYLHHIYTAVTLQTGRLMAEGLNLSHRLLRIRARPKILLAQDYEEAWELFERYRPNVLGVISDVGFPRGGVMTEDAGIELARRVREQVPDLPILLQSADRSHRDASRGVATSFLYKRSPHMLDELRQFIIEQFGFGDFVFRRPDGREISRASDLRGMIRALREVPEDSVKFHAERNHFSAWLKARTEFELASMIRPRMPEDFDSIQTLKQWLISSMTGYLRQIQRHVMVDFRGDEFDEYVAFAKVGAGSLGGKGRGLAFVQRLLSEERIDIPGVEIDIPQTVVLTSDVFEEFLVENGLRRLPREVSSLPDDEILRRFRQSRFNRHRRSELASFLQKFTEPLAVRSSSILEDSLYQSFAGVYATVMLPNNHPSLDVRLAQLLEAIKLVYASTFLSGAREYLGHTPHRVEEERMAVLLQRLVGSRRGDLFYPTLSGVASSYNFYPFGDIRREDGVAHIALGLGKSIVGGFEALRFCPRHPQTIPQFSSVKETLRTAQRYFYALDMERDDMIAGLPADSNLLRREAIEAVGQGAAKLIASTYVRADDRLTTGVQRGGVPIITFAPMLKDSAFPLPEVLRHILDLAQRAMECPVELEFALDFDDRRNGPPVFHLLQIRPIVVEQGLLDVTLDEAVKREAFVCSEDALGYSRRMAVTDLIVVDSARFDRATTQRVANIIEEINRELAQEGRYHILIGPGRWGTQDPWYGIPVTWPQISATRAIVETDFVDADVDPSYGSHFFHNLTVFGVAYLTVRERRNQGRVDWEWLNTQPAIVEEMDGIVRHVRLEQPAEVLVDGSTGHGVLLWSGVAPG